MDWHSRIGEADDSRRTGTLKMSMTMKDRAKRLADRIWSDKLDRGEIEAELLAEFDSVHRAAYTEGYRARAEAICIALGLKINAT